MIIHSEEDGIFEEREALMVSPTGRISTLRTAHFLKPTVSDSINAPKLKLPYLPLCSESSWPISVSFNGWYETLKKWPIWVNDMTLKFGYTWKKSGIYEAIMGSTCKIRKNSELIFGVAERWCCDTSSFLFPWAEATITLEDLLVLGGFSVLGFPFSMPLDSKEMIDVEEGLKKSLECIVKLRKSKGCEVSHCHWLEYFMESKSDLEHEAFLSLWLSRFVFPGNVLDAINTDNFSIAIYLARGIRIALAPTVLASLYRDLSLLKQSILVTSELDMYESKDDYVAITLWSPIQYVQLWAWERLPPLQPKPKRIPLGYPRLARWHGVNRMKRENIRFVIDSSGESFMWRPYAIAVDTWLLPEFYMDQAQWVLSNGNLSEALESYTRFLRVSELVGTDSIEAYLPHRVAMQFGMDQDLPQWIPNSNATSEIAWDNYSRPICDGKLYFPSRHFEGDVTTRYLRWWERSVLDLQGETQGLLKGLRSPTPGTPPGCRKRCNWGRKYMQIWSNSNLDRQDTDDGPNAAVKVNCLALLTNPKSIPGKEKLQSPVMALEMNGAIASNEDNVPDVPPGFPPRCAGVKEMPENFNMQHIQNRSDVNIDPFMAVENLDRWGTNDGPLMAVNWSSLSSLIEPTSIRGKEKVQSSNKRSIQGWPDDDVKPVLAFGRNGSNASIEGNVHDVPPGFPPKCNGRKETLESYNMQHIQNRSSVDGTPGFTSKGNQAKEISDSCELIQVCSNSPSVAFKKQRLHSSAEENRGSRVMEGFSTPIETTKQSETTVRISEPADKSAYAQDTISESFSKIKIESGINYDEGSDFLKTKLKDLDIDTRISLVEGVLAQLKAAKSQCRGVKQEPQS